MKSNAGVLKVLRIALIISFILSVTATLLMYVFKHRYGLHAAHIVLANLTFALITVYFVFCAQAASKYAIEELKANFPPYNYSVEGITAEYKTGSISEMDCKILRGSAEIDISPLNGRSKARNVSIGDIIPRGAIVRSGVISVIGVSQRKYAIDLLSCGDAVFNTCAAYLIRSGILVKNAGSLRAIMRKRSFSPVGFGGKPREGYEISRETLCKIGLSIDCLERDPEIVLADYDMVDKLAGVKTDRSKLPGITISHNKITHILKIVYACRIYRLARRWMTASYCFAAAAAALLAIAGEYSLLMMAAAAASLTYLPIVRSAERKLLRRVTFELIISECGVSKRYLY